MRTSDRARRMVARAVRRDAAKMAEAITGAFFERHPDWGERYGERGWRHGVRDAQYHAEFLAGAVEAGAAESFARYARWAARVLGARGIPKDFLVENLQQVAAWYEEQMDADQASLVRTTVDAGLQALASDAMEERGQTREGNLADIREVFTRACLRGDRRAALTVAEEALHAGISVVDIYVEVLQASQYELGRLWETNQITVAQEHLATVVTQYVVTRLYEHLERPAEQRGRAVVTGVEGELHQLGGHMVADFLESDGWDVRFLGTNLPVEGVLATVQEHEPTIVGISATMLFNLPQVSELMDGVRGLDLDPGPRVVVGGALFRWDADLWRRVSADGCASNLQDVLGLVRSVAG